MKDKQIKICAVCEDIAIAKNFGALSCKSCKPFFRRNAIKNEVFKCQSVGNCEINKTTRKRCRKCRLDKCFAVGMRKDLILNDVEKHFRRSVIEENRKKKQKSEEKYKETNQSLIHIFSESSVFTNSCETIISSNKTDIIDENESKIDSDSGHCSEILDTSADSDLDENQISEIESFLTIAEVIKKSSSQYKPAIDFLSKDLTIGRPVNHFNIKYTELEEYKLMEIFNVFKPLVNYWIKNYEIIDINLPDVPKFNNFIYEVEINNLIKSLRKLNVYENICENDRIALVKYSCMDILSLRAIKCYDLNKESWMIPMDEERAFLFKLDLLKALKNDVYVIYRNYLNDMIKECDSDYVVFDLLTAIALFNPNRPNLINREFVRVQQHVYLYLLQRYLTFKYRTKSESEFKSAKLLNTLINAHILGELEKKYFYDDYRQHYSPIVKEVLDI